MSKQKQGCRSYKGKRRWWQHELTQTKTASHHNVTAWRRAMGGLISWSSFEGQYGREIKATAGFRRTAQSLWSLCVQLYNLLFLLHTTANRGSHSGTSWSAGLASLPSPLVPVGIRLWVLPRLFHVIPSHLSRALPLVLWHVPLFSLDYFLARSSSSTMNAFPFPDFSLKR